MALLVLFIYLFPPFFVVMFCVFSIHRIRIPILFLCFHYMLFLPEGVSLSSPVVEAVPLQMHRVLATSVCVLTD